MNNFIEPKLWLTQVLNMKTIIAVMGFAFCFCIHSCTSHVSKKQIVGKWQGTCNKTINQTWTWSFFANGKGEIQFFNKNNTLEQTNKFNYKFQEDEKVLKVEIMKLPSAAFMDGLHHKLEYDSIIVLKQDSLVIKTDYYISSSNTHIYSFVRVQER